MQPYGSQALRHTSSAHCDLLTPPWPGTRSISTRTMARSKPLWIILCLVSCNLFIEDLRAQTTMNVGVFELRFWNPGDTGNDPFHFQRTQIAPSDLGVFTDAEIDAIGRAFNYWTRKLDLWVVPEKMPVIGIVKDISVTPLEPGETRPPANATALNALFYGEMTNTYARIVTDENALRTRDMDGVIVFEPGNDGVTLNEYDTRPLTQLPSALHQLEITTVHEIGHLLGMTMGNMPYAEHVLYEGDPPLANGAQAVNIYGQPGIPVDPVNISHTLLPYHIITRTRPFEKRYRNVFFGPAELALFADMGYPDLDLSQHFGRAFYQDGTNTPEQVTVPFQSSADFATGMFLQADQRAITITGDVEISGHAGTGIRISANTSDTEVPALHGNKVVIASDTTINVDGQNGIGVLASAGAANHLVVKGNVVANGPAGRGLVFDFGFSRSGPADQVSSQDYNDYLIDNVDITGVVTAQSGLGNAIEIAQTAAIGQINIMAGASITGNISSHALTTDTLNRPTITFGKLANENGEATEAYDPDFTFSYEGEIGGTTLCKADLVGGTTRLQADAAFHQLTVELHAVLHANGTIDTPSGTSLNHGTISGTATLRGNWVDQGTIAPGNSSGAMTIDGNLFKNGGNMVIQLAGHQDDHGNPLHDQLLVTGDLTFGNETEIDLLFLDDFGADDLSFGDTFVVVQHDGALSGFHLLSLDASEALPGSGRSWQLNHNESSIVLRVVPEPGCSLLLAMSLVAIARQQRHLRGIC